MYSFEQISDFSNFMCSKIWNFFDTLTASKQSLLAKLDQITNSIQWRQTWIWHWFWCPLWRQRWQWHWIWFPLEGHVNLDLIVFFTNHLLQSIDQLWRSKRSKGQCMEATDTVRKAWRQRHATKCTTSTQVMTRVSENQGAESYFMKENKDEGWSKTMLQHLILNPWILS